jgi:PHP family Zn ribbon phosphoesterase
MNGMQEIFADLHIHIGRTKRNQPVKITAARNMTFDNIIREASERKGIHLIGIIDAHSPPVQEEIHEGIRSGKYREHPQGGIIYGNTTCILGAELELKEDGTGAFHLLAFFPGLAQIQAFTEWLSRSMKNVQLSTQRVYQPVSRVVEKVLGLGGILIPAHVFTPFKSVYGNAADRMSDLFSLDSLA